MDKDAYIKQLEEESTALKKRIEELERLLGVNSKNSSKPPSSDLPGMPAAKPKHRRKKRGARKGHKPHLRELLPQKFVKQHFHLKPEACICGSKNIEKTNKEPLSLLHNDFRIQRLDSMAVWDRRLNSLFPKHLFLTFLYILVFC